MMNVRLKIYDGCKYTNICNKVKEVLYTNIKGFEVVTGERATKIGEETDGNSRDEYNEYLLITLEDGDTSTFCNSHVDLFIDHRKDDTLEMKGGDAID